MKESEDPESTGTSGSYSEGWWMSKRCVSESGFERADALRVMVFTWREFNAILGSCGVSRTAQSFFESELVDTDFS